MDLLLKEELLGRGRPFGEGRGWIPIERELGTVEFRFIRPFEIRRSAETSEDFIRLDSGFSDGGKGPEAFDRVAAADNCAVLAGGFVAFDTFVFRRSIISRLLLKRPRKGDLEVSSVRRIFL